MKEASEVYLYFNHWRNPSGTARIGKLGSGGLPTTFTSPNPTKSVPNWKRGTGKWVEVPASWFTDGNRGITLGGGTSQFSEYYGRALGHNETTYRRPRLRITYTR